MDTQEFWIPVRFVPHDERPETNNECIKILIPKKCNACGKKLIPTCGSFSKPSGFGCNNSCNHFYTYSDVWSLRIKNGVDSNILLHCQKCNTPNNYAVPNTPVGGYVCYDCRLTEKMMNEIKEDFESPRKNIV